MPSSALAPVLALLNQRWSLAFVHDQLVTSRRFRVLHIAGDDTRECVTAVPDTAASGKRVGCTLTELIAQHGKLGMIVSDNGTELTWKAVLAGCGEAGNEWHNVMPGKPTQNAFVKRLGLRPPSAPTGGCATRCSTRHCSRA